MSRLADEAAYFGAVADGVESCKEEIESLRQQLAAFHSAVEHVTEDGCLRRSFVAMPEGWAMVHKDRLHDLELAEEQLAAAQSEIESAFREGFRSPATYNDVLVNCEDDEWENYKRGMK
ncbi:MAG: hypothetical protein GYA76_02445 [Verrucomicrobia bacterium]|nr:hypothetical protein [Verrucomicrobiota bacterium]